MIQHSHIWVYIQNNWNKNLEVIAASPYSLQHYSQYLVKMETTEIFMDSWMDRENVV